MLASAFEEVRACSALSFNDAGQIALTLARRCLPEPDLHLDHSILPLIDALCEVPALMDDPSVGWMSAAAANQVLLLSHGQDEIPLTVTERVVHTLFLPLVSSGGGVQGFFVKQKEEVLMATVEAVARSGLWSLAKRFIWAPAEESSATSLTVYQVRLAAMLLQEAAGVAGVDAEAQKLLQSLLYTKSRWFASILGLFSTLDIPKEILAATARELITAALAAAHCIQQLDSLLNDLWQECW